MLKIISGQFHPTLEQAFLEHIRTLKTAPLTPILVIGPTSRLIERLQTQLAQHQIPGLNIHFHTLASLADEIVSNQAPLAKPILSDPLFYDTLVKNLLKEGRSFPEMDDLAIPNGFPPAVRATLRDVLDAGVNEEQAEEALKEEFLGNPVDLGSLRSLLHLYRTYLKKIRTLPVYPRSEILIHATELAPQSPFLQKFKNITFYGFYDMTGLQFDFFESIAKQHPSTYFFPYLQNHPAYLFSKRFRDTFLQQIHHEDVFLEPASPQLTTLTEDTKIFSVSGFSDEAMTIATEIVRVHDVEKIPYSEMAVITRSDERLTQAFPRVFHDHHIPFRTSAKTLLKDHPQVQGTIQLLEQTDGPYEGTDDRLKNWPQSDTWSAYIDRAQSVLNATDPTVEKLLFALNSLRTYALLSETVSRRDFLDTLFEKWNRLEDDGPKNTYGVSLLHAEVARGLSFRVVFLIGLEEKGFPRLIREDPFLRDDARFALNATLGHKIGQKITALEEERLLFQMFLEAASEKLYLFYRRTDEEGTIVGASPFLRALAEEQKWDLKTKTQSIPRPWLGKIRETRPESLSYTALVTGFLSAGKTNDALLFTDAANRNADQLKQSLRCRTELQSFEKPGAFDGLVGPRVDALLFREGKVSPTSLENFGRCGFKYFGENILGLKPIDETQIQEGLEAHLKGTAVHNFLETFYEALTQSGTKPLPSQYPTELFERIFTEKIEQLSSEDMNIHPLVWDATKISLKEKLRWFVERDLLAAKESGFSPLYLEKEFTGFLPDFDKKTTWTGRIDRVDQSPNGLRVMDYKTGRFSDKKRVATEALRGQKLQAPLYLLMIEALQKSSKTPLEMSFRYEYPLEDEAASLDLSGDEWREHRPSIIKTIQTELDWIRDGHFIMVPDDAQCSWCEIAQICRKNHGVSIYRSRQGEGEKFWTLREKK